MRLIFNKKKTRNQNKLSWIAGNSKTILNKHHTLMSLSVSDNILMQHSKETGKICRNAQKEIKSR
jgi:hypothetical protein